MTDLVNTLLWWRDEDLPSDLRQDLKHAADEITRLRKIVDALTIKLNKELNERYVSEALMKERCDSLEHRLARMRGRVEQLRYAKEGSCSSSPGSSQGSSLE